MNASTDPDATRAPRALADGEKVSLGRHVMQWLDTPHLPHAWECGLMMETTTAIECVAALRPRTLACMHGSAFQGDAAALLPALVERVGPAASR